MNNLKTEELVELANNFKSSKHDWKTRIGKSIETKIDNWTAKIKKSIKDWTVEIEKLEKELIKQKIKIELEKYFIKQITKIEESDGDQSTNIKELVKNFTEKIKITKIEDLEEDDFIINLEKDTTIKQIEGLTKDFIKRIEISEVLKLEGTIKQISVLVKNFIKEIAVKIFIKQITEVKKSKKESEDIKILMNTFIKDINMIKIDEFVKNILGGIIKKDSDKQKSYNNIESNKDPVE